MKLTHTISLVELLWTASAAFGFYFQMKLWFRAVGDFQAVRIAKINSLREYSARLTVWTYSSWVFVQFCFLVVGILALTLPSPNNNGQPTTSSYVISVTFILVSFILAISAYVTERGREKLLKYIEEIEQTEVVSHGVQESVTAK